jgi:hypothetical protein
MTPHCILRYLGSVLATAAIAAIVSGTAHAASADPSGLEPELAAKVARERLKQPQRGTQSGSGKGGGGDSSCGQVDIGNDNPNDRSAASRLNERSKTVIVTGDVINAPRCR